MSDFSAEERRAAAEICWLESETFMLGQNLNLNDIEPDFIAQLQSAWKADWLRIALAEPSAVNKTSRLVIKQCQLTRTQAALDEAKKILDTVTAFRSKPARTAFERFMKKMEANRAS